MPSSASRGGATGRNQNANNADTLASVNDVRIRA
jgi:hypothetical protein